MAYCPKKCPATRINFRDRNRGLCSAPPLPLGQFGVNYRRADSSGDLPGSSSPPRKSGGASVSGRCSSFRRRRRCSTDRGRRMGSTSWVWGDLLEDKTRSFRGLTWPASSSGAWRCSSILASLPFARGRPRLVNGLIWGNYIREYKIILDSVFCTQLLYRYSSDRKRLTLRRKENT